MTQHLLLGHFHPPMQGRTSSNPHLPLGGQLDPAETKAQRGQVLAQSHTLLCGVVGTAQVPHSHLQPHPSQGVFMSTRFVALNREWCCNGIYIPAPTIRQGKAGGQVGTLPPPPRL